MITITGATGLLGSRLAFDLVSAGHSIKALKRPSSNIKYVREVFKFYSDDPDKFFRKIEWLDFDIEDFDSVIEALEGTSRLYHAAAFVSFNPKDRKRMLTNNFLGTTNIVNACLDLKIEKLCHVSSTAALGSVPEGKMVTEDIIWTPDEMNSAYSVSKFKSEMEVWRGMEEGLNAVIVNPSVIFGAGFWNKGSSSIFTTINNGLRYCTNGVTGFVSVKDVSKCMILLMDSNVSGERFIISSQNLSYREVFKMISTSLNVNTPELEASPFLAGLVCQLDFLRSVFTGNRVITKEAVQAGKNKKYFSNEKIKMAVGIEFEKIEDVIRELARCF